MIDGSILAAKWEQALPYEPYVATGTAEQQRRWAEFRSAITLKPAQQVLVASFVRPMRVLTISGIWCGDCVQQVPFLELISAAQPNALIQHRLLDRDLHRDLSSQLKICGGDRVPVALLLSKDFDFCALLGDRTLARYRLKAEREFGGSCATGLIVPAAEELAATCADWLAEIERVQLMLRLSPRYRKEYAD